MPPAARPGSAAGRPVAVAAPPDPLLDLAGRLAIAGSLTGQVDTTLPVVARLRTPP